MNGIQQGPYEYEELKQLPINEETPVWYEGLPAWTPAGKAPATSPIFGNGEQVQTEPARSVETATPQQPVNNSHYDLPAAPKKFFGWSIVLTLIFFSPIAILAIISGIVTSIQYNSGNYKGAQKMSNITEWLIMLAITFGCISLPMMFML